MASQRTKKSGSGHGQGGNGTPVVSPSQTSMVSWVRSGVSAGAIARWRRARVIGSTSARPAQRTRSTRPAAQLARPVDEVEPVARVGAGELAEPDAQVVAVRELVEERERHLVIARA